MDRVVAGEVARRMRARADREEREARQSREAASTRRTFVRMPEDGQDEGHPIRTNMGPSHAAREAEDEHPSCRICFGDGDVEELGRLFSPCLCRGTNSHVHTECLNSWRRLSSNANSYWRCDQCKYNYRTVKLGHVDILQNPALVTTAAALLILAVSLLAGFVVTCILPGPAHVARLYKMLSFVPPWKAKLVDMCFVGFFLIGLGGFGIVVYFRVTRYPQYFMHVVVPSLVFSTLANGFRFLRVVAFLGFVTASIKVYSRILLESQRWIMKHGEAVLDIREHGVDATPIVRASLSPVHSTVLSFASWINRFMGIRQRPAAQAHRRRA